MELFGLPDWIVLTGTVCVLVYLYASWNRNYWKNQNVVSEPFSFPFGATFKLLFKPMCQLDSERYKRYGRVFGTFEMGNAVLFVGEAKLVEQILVEDFPSLPNRRTLTFNDPVLDNMMSMTPFERWRKIRMPVAQAFSTENVKKMHSLIEDCALITVDHLKKAAFTEEDIDAKKFFGSYTLDVIARCVFATRIDSHLDGKSEFVKRSRQAPSGRLTPRIFVYFLFPFIARATGLRPLSPSVLEYFRRFSQNVIISTQKEEPGGHPSLEAVTKLKYLHCVISESLRMCPPVSRLERVPCCDYTLGDKGVKVKKGDLITIPVYAMHHDPLYFPDPMSFKPERFNEENVSSIVPYSYLPFGGGPRNCVALRFALLAVNLAVLHTIRNVEVVRTEKTKVPLQFKKGFGLLTAKDIVLGVRPRQ
uniref:Putative cytochrome n=1 Tax=Rhipicephalus microplus TaxID=6941 RepID=A0A6M2D5H4_RHIMP